MGCASVPQCLGEIAVPQILPAAWTLSVRMLGTDAEKHSGTYRHYFHPELSCWLPSCFLQHDSKSFICSCVCVCVCVCVFIPVSFIYCDFAQPASGKPSVEKNEFGNTPFLVPVLESRFIQCV